jgi:hypothetical protein
MGVLATLAVLGGAILFAALPATAGDDSHVEGSYWLEGQSNVDHHPFHVVSALSPGGVITSIVSTDTATEVGQWALDDDHALVAKFYAFATAPDGTPIGTATVRIKGKVRGGTLSGTYWATGTTTSGSELFPPDNGTFSGKRIKADG